MILAIAYLVFQYLARLLMPFVLALFTAFLTRPLARFLSRETREVRREGKTMVVRRRVRLSRPAAGAIGVLALLFPLIALLGILTGRALNAAASLLSALPGLYEQRVAPGAARLYERALSMGECLDGPLRTLLASAGPTLLSDAGRMLTSFSGRAVAAMTALAARLPGLALDLTVFVIASVFLAADYDRIRSFARRNLPERALRCAVNVRASFSEMARRFLKSYFLLFCITVGEIALGLALLGVKGGGRIALAIGVLDAFPVVGSGLVLLPWTLWCALTGEGARAAGLLALYLWVTVFRQCVEPRLLGRRVGLRPVVTLLCMYAGGRLFGGVGLLGLPVTAAILTDMNSNGVIRLFDRGTGPAGRGSAAAEET